MNGRAWLSCDEKRDILNARPADVYRCFDAAGNLLYVGCGLSYKNRLAWHRLMSPWFAEMATVAVERYETRWEALDAERDAIKTEGPKHNCVHAQGWTHPAKKQAAA